MKEKITKVGNDAEGVALPESYMRYLELIPGAEVELMLDKEKKWIIIRALHSEDFLDHFKNSMESMA